MTSKQNTNSQPIELQFHVEPDTWLPVAELLTMFHPHNSQTRSRAELDAIKRHLTEAGFVAEMIVVNPVNRKIVSGHGRTQAAHELGFTGSLPVVYREYKTEAEHRRAMLRWNLARGHQDEAKEAADFGLEEGEFEALLKEFAPPTPLEDPGPQTNRAEELREKWQVESGQMWQLGAHRLICGDCTDAAVVERLMGEEKADMVFTSPPYNRGTTTGGGFNSGGLSQQLTDNYIGYSDDRPSKDYYDWQGALLLSWWDMLADDGAIFYNHRPRVQSGIYETPLNWNPGLPVRQIVIWHSGAGINFAPTHYRVAHEWIVIFAKPSFRLSSKGESGVGDVWQFGAASVAGHPAPFPVEIASRALETTDTKIIYEPFSGSGTTLIACEQLSRKCRAVEISPAYVAVALQRWADMTGQTPELLP